MHDSSSRLPVFWFAREKLGDEDDDNVEEIGLEVYFDSGKWWKALYKQNTGVSQCAMPVSPQTRPELGELLRATLRTASPVARRFNPGTIPYTMRREVEEGQDMPCISLQEKRLDISFR